MDLEIRQLQLRYATLRVLDPGRVARLAAAIARDGQRAPVLVVGADVLVDGYHRVEAMQQLGRDLVTAVALDVAEPDALVLAWRLETGRRRTALEEGWFLRELVEVHGRTQAGLATELRRSRSWVSQRLGLVRALPEAVQEAVRRCRVPAHGAMKALLPMARVDRIGCEQLVASLAQPLTVRQLERVYAAWRKADPQGRARIVSHPDLLLKAEEAVAPVPLDDQDRLAADFEAIAGLCRRARRHVRAGVFARANTPVLGRAWQQAGAAFATLNEEVGRAGSGDPDRDPAPER